MGRKKRLERKARAAKLNEEESGAEGWAVGRKA
jgi:hypothetical protein